MVYMFSFECKAKSLAFTKSTDQQDNTFYLNTIQDALLQEAG